MTAKHHVIRGYVSPGGHTVAVYWTNGSPAQVKTTPGWTSTLSDMCLFDQETARQTIDAPHFSRSAYGTTVANIDIVPSDAPTRADNDQFPDPAFLRETASQAQLDALPGARARAAQALRECNERFRSAAAAGNFGADAMSFSPASKTEDLINRLAMDMVADDLERLGYRVSFKRAADRHTLQAIWALKPAPLQAFDSLAQAGYASHVQHRPLDMGGRGHERDTAQSERRDVRDMRAGECTEVRGSEFHPTQRAAETP